jgi:hypothetical protein
LGFSIFEAKAEGNGKQSKIFLGFSSSKPKIASKTTKGNKPKNQIERNN